MPFQSLHGWLKVVVGVVTVAAVLVGLLWFFQRRLIFLPDTSAAPPAAQVLVDGRDVVLHTEDGLDLAAWYIAASGSSGDCRPTVLVANGNAGNRLSRVPLAQALAAAGFGVLLFDYRGYGGNPGSPTEDGLAADARAAQHFLTADEGISDGELFYFGESLGAAVVTGLAVQRPPAGLVLRSPFSALADVAGQHYPFLPVRLLLRDRFDVVGAIGGVPVPTTVIYGTADGVVAPEHSQAVAAAAGGTLTTVVVSGADHNDPELGWGPEVITAAVELAERAGCSPTP